jgi:hypothetical protein
LYGWIIFRHDANPAHNGEPSQLNGYGVMHLADNPMNQSLNQAALLLNVSVDTLKKDVRKNIRGGSAILAKHSVSSTKTGIVVHEPASLPYPGDWCGYEELGRLFKTMHNTWSSMNIENMLATLDVDTLFMGYTLVATARLSEKEVRFPFAKILKMKDNLVIEAFPYYFDTALIKAVLS